MMSWVFGGNGDLGLAVAEQRCMREFWEFLL